MTDQEIGALLPAFLLLASLVLMIVDFTMIGRASAR
jgi:hypothetical protein